MYYFSNWFPSLSSYLPLFLDIIKSNREVVGWKTHSLGNEILIKSLYHTYETKSPDICCVESHRYTIDLQYCYSGGEKISFQQFDLQKNHITYLEDRDKDLWSVELSSLSSLIINEDKFVLFKPNQLHCPQQYDGKNKSIEKIVLKIPCEILTIP